MAEQDKGDGFLFVGVLLLVALLLAMLAVYHVMVH